MPMRSIRTAATLDGLLMRLPHEVPYGMHRAVRIPITLEPQPGGGYAVRCPDLPELITEGDSEEAALANAWDALLALLDAYDQIGRPLPLGLPVAPDRSTVEFQPLTAA